MLVDRYGSAAVAGSGLSTAWLLGYASIVLTIATNDNTEFQSLSEDIKRLQGWYRGAAIATLVLRRG